MQCYAKRAAPAAGSGGSEPPSEAPMQLRRNRTGLPDGLKAGMEASSGLSLDRVQVRYNSPEPARFDALAMARGTRIDVAPGQERQVPHELGHVVQQLQRRVRPTAFENGVPLNEDPRLEAEADRLGAGALRGQGLARPGAALPDPGVQPLSAAPVQLARPKAPPKAKARLRQTIPAAAAAPTPRTSPRLATAVRPNYAMQMTASGRKPSPRPYLLYPSSLKALVPPSLWGRRVRGPMSDALTKEILDNAVKVTQSRTKQEVDIINTVSPANFDNFLLTAFNANRNHKLADSAIFSIFAEMITIAGKNWGPVEEKGVADLTEALYGDNSHNMAVLNRLQRAVAAANDQSKGDAISDAAKIAALGPDNLRIGNAGKNQEILAGFDQNADNSGDYFRSDPSDPLHGQTVNKQAALAELKIWVGTAQSGATPPLQRKMTMRSDKIQRAVQALAGSKLISRALANACTTGVYHRTTGKHVVSSKAQ